MATTDKRRYEMPARQGQPVGLMRRLAITRWTQADCAAFLLEMPQSGSLSIATQMRRRIWMLQHEYA
jgi:hypothetical protein